jgi:hypothetical protein
MAIRTDGEPLVITTGLLFWGLLIGVQLDGNVRLVGNDDRADFNTAGIATE